MTSGAIAAMLSTILYSRRFFPYYVYNIIGGLDEEGRYFNTPVYCLCLLLIIPLLAYIGVFHVCAVKNMMVSFVISCLCRNIIKHYSVYLSCMWRFTVFSHIA